MPTPKGKRDYKAEAARETPARQQALSHLIREVLPPLLPEGLSLPVQ